MGSFLIIVVVHFMRPTAVVALVVLHLPVAVSALTLMSAPAWVSLPRTAVAPGMRLGGGHARRRPRPTVVGLVGGIASGKSTVSRALAAECGLEVIDADKLGHESYQPGTRCFGKLVDAFGAKIVAGDGTIDRRALGQAVFGNQSNMATLQGIVWPEIRLLAEQRIDEHAEEGTKAVVLEAAVLLEAGWDDMCNELWVVQVPPAVARARLMKRNGFSEEEANKRLASQPMTDAERAARAAVVLSNEGTEEDLVAKVKETWAARAGVLRNRRRRDRSLVYLGLAAIAATAVVAAVSVVLRRGRVLR